MPNLETFRGFVDSLDPAFLVAVSIVVTVLVIGGLEHFAAQFFHRHELLTAALTFTIGGIFLGLGLGRATGGVTEESGCQSASSVVWQPAGGHDAWPDTTLVQDIPACTTLMVASRTMTLPSGFCDGGDDRVCVAVWRASPGTMTIRVAGLTANHTWWGTTDAGVDRAIRDKVFDSVRGWFTKANCSTGKGCVSATIAIFGAGDQLLGTESRSMPALLDAPR